VTVRRRIIFPLEPSGGGGGIKFFPPKSKGAVNTGLYVDDCMV
jgi:hypothetical protein